MEQKKEINFGLIIKGLVFTVIIGLGIYACLWSTFRMWGEYITTMGNFFEAVFSFIKNLF